MWVSDPPCKMAEGSRSDSVLLVISQGGHDSRIRGLSREIDGREMGCEEWQSLVAESDKLAEIRIRVDRELLSQHSTYFKGYMNFSEPNPEVLNVEWILPIFCSLLQCIHGCQPYLSSSMVASLIEGAIYFGVEDVITNCKSWAASKMCNIRWGTEDDFLHGLLSIWLSASENGVKSIEELCVKSLAINFAQAMLRESFVTLPLSLLEASIDHPELTIKSEMDLCNALLIWYENQENGLPKEAVVEDPTWLFNKIQLDLLPIDFILRRLVGKYPLNIFHTSSTSSDSDADLLNPIIDLRGELASKPVKDYLNFKPVIRLSDYLKELDFSGCHQITSHHFISAAGQFQSKPKNTIRKARLASEQEVWPDFPEFINLQILNLSHCWRVDQKSLLTWLKLACPNLLELRAPHCHQLLEMIPQICASLPNLSALDLSEPEELVDIVGAVTRTKSIELHRVPLSWDSGKLSVTNNLSDLSLRGRLEITDGILLSIACHCPSLWAVDLSGCSGLSDGGVSAFLMTYNCSGFRKLSVAGTGFGSASCKALISQANADYQLRHVLETLDLSRCSALGCEHLSNLLQALPSLVFLALAFTRLDDTALSVFFGASLRHLNVRETKVSGGVLSRIMERNSNLEDLNIRGCTQLTSDPLVHSLDFQKIFEWQNVEAGWGLSDSTFSFCGFASRKLQNFAVGVGGTITADTLLRISEKCPELKRLSLCFQIIPDAGLIRAIRKLKSLHTLELQNMTHSSRDLLIEIARSLPNLKTLKLERVAPWLSDHDFLIFSQSCTGLQSLSLLGCQRLTSISLSNMAQAWHGLQDLRLEECKQILTHDKVWLLLRSFQALQVLHLRHIGKVLPENFIAEATKRLPLLQKLAIDMCDAVNDKFSSSERMGKSRLKSVYINRCRTVRDSFHGVRALASDATSVYNGRTHKDTIVLEWNSVRLKESVVSERLTFD